MARARCGKKLCFHGAFKSKSSAVKKEKRVHGFILKRRIRGRGTRYLVLTRKGKR